MAKKRIFIFSIILAVIVFATQTMVVSALADAGTSNALFVNNVTLTKNESDYVVLYTFDKETAEQDVLDAYENLFSMNDVKLSSISGSDMAFSAGGLRITIPVSAGIVVEGAENKAVLFSGIENNGNITTVRYIHTFLGEGTGERVYRSDDYDDYEGVTVTSISIPETQSANMSVYIYFSDMITSKKLADFQIRSLSFLKGAHDENSSYPYYTSAELDLYYSYEMLTSDWDNSLIYKMMYGCDSYNGLEAFPGNHSGETVDMTPQCTVEGTDLYTIYQIQEQTADDTIYYYNNEGELRINSSSQQPLVVQVHFDENYIQLVLKGDSTRDTSLASIADAEGNETGGTSFNENIAPDLRETMAIGFKAGLLFPNGKMLKEDVVFCYDSSTKTWSAANSEKSEYMEDDTLDNQEGYTDEELEALANGTATYIGTTSLLAELNAISSYSTEIVDTDSMRVVVFSISIATATLGTVVVGVFIRRKNGKTHKGERR